ncbi:hypothetical protein HY640_00225 [Candidatus Woesearchaeota archaeon]|nr:hypothetical protein [Candidatus Woesearchaeota archaeon]
MCERRHGLSEVRDSVFSSMLELFGVCGTADARLRFLADKWNSDLQRGVILVERSCVESLRAALCLVQHVGGSNAVVRSLGVSGILRKVSAGYLQKQ